MSNQKAYNVGMLEREHYISLTDEFLKGMRDNQSLRSRLNLLAASDGIVPQRLHSNRYFGPVGLMCECINNT